MSVLREHHVFPHSLVACLGKSVIGEGHIVQTIGKAGASMTVTPIETDPLWDKVALLIQAPESGSTIVDATGKTITPQGNVAVSDALGYPTVLFDGNGDRMDIGADAGAFNFMHNGGAWTVEAELRPSAIGNDDTILDTTRGTTSNSGVFIAYTSSKIYVFITRGVSDSYVLNAELNHIFSADVTKKVCIEYNPALEAEHLKLYVDGVYVAGGYKYAATPPSTSNHQAMMIGMFAAGAPASAYTGHMRFLRVTQGIRYGANHTPPSWPLITA